MPTVDNSGNGSMYQLTAYVRDAFIDGSPADHTWVEGSDGAYWYCWGEMKPADGTLLTQAANIACAKCLVRPDVRSEDDVAARGTILVYGVHGVCHQLANQVLWSTGVNGSAPRNVKGARYYNVSSALYTAYGIRWQAWRALRRNCPFSTPSNATPADDVELASRSQRRGESDMHGREQSEVSKRIDQVEDEDPLFDPFPARARAAGVDPANVAALVKRRAQLWDQLREARERTSGADFARTVNYLNNGFLRYAAEMLTREQYVGLFDTNPGTDVNLVDPEIAERQPH